MGSAGNPSVPSIDYMQPNCLLDVGDDSPVCWLNVWHGASREQL